MDHRFVACGSVKPTPREVWLKSEPNNWFGNEPCSAMELGNKTGMFDFPCEVFPVTFICEVLYINIYIYTVLYYI
jgi:hypothetical protein